MSDIAQINSEPSELDPVQQRVWQKISDLEGMLKTNDPLIGGHLGAIHKELNQYEELNHLLTDDQIRDIVRAQTQVTGTVLIAKIQKSSAPSIAKQAKKLSLSNDLAGEL